MSDNKFNVLILGNAAVGKTNIIKVYVGQAFDYNSKATLGIDYVNHKFKASGSEKEFDTKIWDTAGQERFESLTHSFYRQAKGMIVCFDLTNAESFKKVKKWIASIQEHADPNISTVLVGTKCDLKEGIVITNQEAKECAKNNGMNYFETSALSNTGIKEMFEDLFN